MEDGSEGEAEDEFSWIAVVEEVEKNPEEADIAIITIITKNDLILNSTPENRL